MKEVKIYTIISDQLSPPIIGESFCTDMVRHSDYAELEAKCAALAAENAGLKEAAEFSTATDMWEELGGNMMRYLYQEWYAEKLKAALQTPATDAFLAEVRAQGVDAAIEAAKNLVAQEYEYKDFKAAQSDCCIHPGSDLVGKVEMTEWLVDFAAQLRKGVRS
ncbi:hypothetical protein WKN31_003703 [Escherichia coli]